MKTKIRTIIVVCALGIIGLMNINAISDDKKEIVNDNAEMLSIEFELTDEAIIYSAQSYSDMDIENEIEEHATTENITDENILPDGAIIYSAQAFSDLDFENEIANRQ